MSLRTQASGGTLALVMKILFTVCTIATVLFIFSNSMEIADVSGGKSAAVTAWLNNGLSGLGIGYRFSEGIVRKLAHLSEFALLGFFLMMDLRVYTKRILTHIFFPLFVGLAVPVADESIQLFTDGRSAEVRDILIDFSGVLCGIAAGAFLLLLVRMLTFAIRNRREL